MGTDITKGRDGIAQGVWAVLLSTETEVSTQLEDLVHGRLKTAASGQEVRDIVEELIDDEEVGGLYSRLIQLIPDEAFEAAVADLQTLAQEDFVGPELVEKLDLAWRLASTRIPLAVRIKHRLEESPPEDSVAAEASNHPRVAQAVIKLVMATIAGIGLSSNRRAPLADFVVETLVDLCIEGERAHLAFLVSLADVLGIDAAVDEALCPPDARLDLEELARQLRSAISNRQRRLEEARSTVRSSKTAAALALVDQWLSEPGDYDHETWPEVAQGIDENRTSNRKLF